MKFKHIVLVGVVAIAVISCGWMRGNARVPERIEANAAPATSVVTSTPAQSTGDFGGIYAVTPKLNESSDNLPDAVYSRPEFDGVFIRLTWNNIEPSAGTYNWTLLDREVERSVRAGKKISLGVVTGASTPDWVFAEGVPANTFYVTAGRKVGACLEVKIPTPWDENYIAAYDRLMQALANHLKAKQAYDSVRIVKITGMNKLSLETWIPFRREPAEDGNCNSSDGLATWQAAGYRPSKAIQAWQQLANSVNRAFPDKVLSMAIVNSNDFPLINEQGQQVRRNDPSNVDVKQQLFTIGLQSFPGRFAVQWNGLSADKVSPVVLEAGQRGAIIGWQSNQYLGTGAGCNATTPARATPCTNTSFDRILQNGIATGGQFIEVFPENILQFPDVIDRARTTLRSR